MGFFKKLLGMEDNKPQAPQQSHSVVAEYGAPQQFSPGQQAALTEARRPKWGAELGQASSFAVPQPPAQVDGINQQGFLYSEPMQPQQPSHSVVAQYGGPQQFSPEQQAELTEARRPKAWSGGDFSAPQQQGITSGPAAGAATPAAHSRYMQTQVMPAVQQPPSYTNKGTQIMPAVSPPAGPGQKK